MKDGTTFPSLFHRNSADVISSVDLYFPTERIAVFCDGSSHSRRERRSKDAAINAKLEALGIKPVRVLGSEIKFDLAKAASRVKEALANSYPREATSG